MESKIVALVPLYKENTNESLGEVLQMEGKRPHWCAGWLQSSKEYFPDLNSRMKVSVMIKMLKTCYKLPTIRYDKKSEYRCSTHPWMRTAERKQKDLTSACGFAIDFLSLLQLVFYLKQWNIARDLKESHKKMCPLVKTRHWRYQFDPIHEREDKKVNQITVHLKK